MQEQRGSNATVNYFHRKMNCGIFTSKMTLPGGVGRL